MNMVPSTTQAPEKDRLHWFAACSLPASMVCFYFAGMIYHFNADFIDSPFGYIALILAPMWLVITLLLAAPSLFLKGRGRQIYLNFLACSGIALWVIGSFLFFQRGLLDGKELLRSDTIIYQWTELVSLAAGVLVLIVLGLRFQLLIVFAALILHFMAAGMFATALLRDKKSYFPNNKNDAFYEVSSNKNAFIFVFDSFQSDLFQAILKKETALYEKLDGFTYFPDTTGVAPTTYLSLPAMHSGVEYNTKLSLTEYYNQTVRTNSFLTKLAEAGYDAAGVNFINAYPKEVSHYSGKYLVNEFWGAATKDAFYLFDISLYRSAPSCLKQSIYNHEDWFLFNLFFGTSRIKEKNGLLTLIGEKFHAAKRQPAVRWIHLFSTHPPALVDANCDALPYSPWTKETAQGQATCAMKTFVNMLEKFQQKQIYDNSVIVVTADHGQRFSFDGKPGMIGAAHPVFLAKPAHQRGRLMISKGSIFLTDLPKTVCSLTADCEVSTGISAFQSQRPNGRSITFNDYKWEHKLWRSPFVPIRSRYKIVGPVEDILSWYRQIPPERIRRLTLDFTSNDEPDAFGFGWGWFEKGRYGAFRYAIAPNSQLYLPLKPNQNATVNITVSTHPRNKDQFVSLYLNQTKIGRQPIPIAKPTVVQFEIPAKQVSSSVSRLTFMFEKCLAPRKGGRMFAAAFYRLEVVYP